MAIFGAAKRKQERGEKVLRVGRKRESVYDVKSMGIITYVSVKAARALKSNGMAKIGT